MGKVCVFMRVSRRVETLVSLIAQSAPWNRIVLHELVSYTEQHAPPSTPAAEHADCVSRRRRTAEPARGRRGDPRHAQRREPAAAQSRNTARLRPVRAARSAGRVESGGRSALAQRAHRAGRARRRRAGRGRSRAAERRSGSASPCCRRSRSAGCCRASVAGTRVIRTWRWRSTPRIRSSTCSAKASTRRSGRAAARGPVSSRSCCSAHRCR